MWPSFLVIWTLCLVALFVFQYLLMTYLNHVFHEASQRFLMMPHITMMATLKYWRHLSSWTMMQVKNTIVQIKKAICDMYLRCMDNELYYNHSVMLSGGILQRKSEMCFCCLWLEIIHDPCSQGTCLKDNSPKAFKTSLSCRVLWQQHNQHLHANNSLLLTIQSLAVFPCKNHR